MYFPKGWINSSNEYEAISGTKNITAKRSINIQSLNTAIFIMAVSPAVLAHDVSASAGDVSMGIAVFHTGWIYLVRFEKLGDR